MRYGLVPSLKRLKQKAKELELKISRKELSKMRYKFKASALHSKFTRPLHYMGHSMMKYGCLQVDHAEFYPRWRLKNKGARGFIVGVEVLSQQLRCVPVKNKNMESWNEALDSMLSDPKLDGIHTVMSDRDSVATSQRFLKRLEEKYGVDWDYLRSRSKAFKAERAIRFLKSRLAMALKAQKTMNWVQFVPKIVDDYNAQSVSGTDIPRKSVNRHNYMKLVKQLLGTHDASTFVNISDVSAVSGDWGNIFFRFAVGDKVLLAREADYQRGHLFKSAAERKRSVSGPYSDFVYTITSRKLKHNSRMFLTVVYTLSGLKGYFYESELRSALFDK